MSVDVALDLIGKSPGYFVPVELIDRTQFVPQEGVGAVSGNVSEYICGIRCTEEQEKMAARLRWDHERLKQKYGLPRQEEKYADPVGYISKLKQTAKERGIKIYGPDEYRARFGKELKEGYTDNDDGKVYVKADSKELVTAYRLEHEMVHAMQVINGDIKKGRIPEELEYEAYVVANLNLVNLAENPVSVFDHIFANGIPRSCRNWYERYGGEAKWEK